MLNWLCAGRIGLGWAHDAISFACHMFMHSHAYVLYFQHICYIWNMFGAFLIVAFFPLSIMFMLVVSMATKRKFTPSQNPVRFRALSSSDPTPSYIQFHDEDAWKDFSKNFSWWGVHLELRRHWPTQFHSQSGLGVTVWHPGHISICAD